MSTFLYHSGKWKLVLNSLYLFPVMVDLLLNCITGVAVTPYLF